jgi:hypothetical protein
MLKQLKTWMPRLLVGAATLVAIFFLGRSVYRFAYYNWATVTFPYSVDYGEGPILDQVMRISRLQNIYKTDISHPPFTVTNYPPLYQVVQAPFAWIFGPAYWYGRALSMFSVIAAALFIAMILFVITKDRTAGLLGGLTLLAIPYILHWSPFCRVDSFALGLSLAGVFIIARWPDTCKGVILAGLLLTAAVYTRQSYALAAPSAAFFWLIGNRHWKRALQLVGVMASVGLGTLLILMLLTRGGFYFNIVTANINPYQWNTVHDYADAIWHNMRYLVIGSVLFLLGGIFLKNKIWWLAAPYLAGGTLSAITIGKSGSNVNYLFEFSAGLCLVAGAIISVPGKRGWFLKIPLILLLAWQVNQLYQWTIQNFYSGTMYRVNNERGIIKLLQAEVHEARGPVLADEFMGLVVLDGRRLYFQPFEFKQLVLHKAWDETPFLKAIENKEFGLILFYAPQSWDSRRNRWTQAQLDALYKNYILAATYANTLVYTPHK